MTDIAAIRELVRRWDQESALVEDAALFDPASNTGVSMARGSTLREVVIALRPLLLAATPSVEPLDATEEHDMACGRDPGVPDPLCAACRETTERCKPNAHRYARIGAEDQLRCRRCGEEKYG